MLGVLLTFICFWFFLFKLLTPGDDTWMLNGQSSGELININELFHIGNCLLNVAGKEIVRIRKEIGDSSNFSHQKADRSIVTRADLISHSIILHSLERKYKNIRFISEENDNTEIDAKEIDRYLKQCDDYVVKGGDKYAPKRDLSVWIDPLDATQEYSGIFTISPSTFYDLSKMALSF
jgi:3'-phosphoadenosine 5'-phosphosulfate (PAPS) 3'-phosphatase